MTLSKLIKHLQDVETKFGGDLNVFVERDGNGELHLLPATFYIACDQDEKPSCVVLVSQEDVNAMCDTGEDDEKCRCAGCECC